MTKLLVAIMVVLACLALSGCRRLSVCDHRPIPGPHLAETEPIWGKLLPEEQCEPADLHNAEIMGKLDQSNRERLARLIGRLQNIDHKVFRVETWDQDVVIAARIHVVGKIIYCTQNDRGVWGIATVSTVSAGGIRNVE